MIRREKGIVLPVVIAIVVIFAITGMVLLSVTGHEITLSRTEANRTKAFYLAEAGLAKIQEQLQMPVVGDLNSVFTESMEQGNYTVQLNTSQYPCYVTATGISGNVQKTIRVQATFLAPPLENAVYAMNKSGADWALQLRGTGDPIPQGWGAENGGKDMINGNIFVYQGQLIQTPKNQTSWISYR